MSFGGDSRCSWMQCTTCGKIHKIPDTFPIEELYVEINCPSCDSHVGLNLGSEKEDLYYFYNVTLDDRYFTY